MCEFWKAFPPKLCALSLERLQRCRQPREKLNRNQTFRLSCAPYLPGIRTRQLQDESMQSMNKLRVGKEHKWAMAFDYIYAVFMAELHRLWSDGTRSAASVQPDTANARFSAILHYPLRISG